MKLPIRFLAIVFVLASSGDWKPAVAVDFVSGSAWDWAYRGVTLSDATARSYTGFDPATWQASEEAFQTALSHDPDNAVIWSIHADRLIRPSNELRVLDEIYNDCR